LSCQTAELAAIVVHPDFHGKGVARELYRLFEEQAIRIGVRRMRSTVLASNVRTIAFNKKIGLRRVEVLPKDLVFEKLLPSQPQTAGKPEEDDAREGTIPAARLAPNISGAGSKPRRWDAMNARPPYILVLTHDADVLSLRELPWSSRTLWGVILRCLIGNVVRLLRGRISLSQYLRGLLPAALLPLVKSQILADPIEGSFRKMLEIERQHGVRSTLYFIPEANLPGTAPSGRAAPSHRAAYYSIQRMRQCLRQLESEGWEIGVHGVNAYCDLGAARRELQAVSGALGHNGLGHRSHWLYSKGRFSWELLRDAGYSYDASYGSNFHVGWPGGKRWPFRPFPDHPFAVLGLNIQDETLLHATRRNLSHQDAWRRISALMGDARRRGGVLTVLWHAHSFSAPRYWADTYEKIISQAKMDGVPIVPARKAIALWRERGEPDG
jgi:peptidoglycan/xylan/chitin deacetylase (PgdA/CDA1 family)